MQQINAANEIIKNNINSLKKTLYTDNEEWEKIIYIDAITDKQESSIISNIIKEKSSEGNYSDNLILYRNNAQSRQIEEALMMDWIPYRVIWGQRFYDRKEIKDILCYLKYVYNPSDSVSMKRIINTPARKIWPKSISVIDEYKNNFGLSYDDILSNADEIDDLWVAARNALKYFYQMIQDFRVKSKQVVVSELIKYILINSWYDEYLKADNSKEEYEARIENIDELINLASNYNWMDPYDSLTQFLEEVLLITDMDKNEEINDYVTLMTIHTSKGLEYNRVFITWLEESIFPSFKSMNDPESLEEERRLMYVALTRAKKEVYISRARERFQYWNYISNPESRFIKEIPSEYISEYETSFSNPFSWVSINNLTTTWNFTVKKKLQENDVNQFEVWTRVNHPKFGVWVITSLNWDIWEIAFSWIWIKKMNVKIAPIKIV